MLNGNFIIYEREKKIEELENRIKKLEPKIKTIANKSLYFLKLVKEIDGNLNIVPDLIYTKGHQVDDILIWIDKTLPTMYVGNINLKINILNREVNSNEKIYKTSLKDYEKVLDDLIALYLKKGEITEKISNEDTIDYRHEVLKTLNIFSIYGVTEASLIYFDKGVKVRFEEREKDYIDKLIQVFNVIVPIDVTISDYDKVMDILDKFSHIRLLDEKTKDEVYNNVEEYINELSNKKNSSK